MDEEDAPFAATLEIAFDPPLVVGGRPYASISLREPRVSEMRASEELIGTVATPANVTDAEMRLVSLVSGYPDEVVEKLSASQHDRAVLFLTGFEPPAREEAERFPSLELEFDPPVEIQKGVFHEMRLREPTIGERRRAEAHLAKGVTAASLRNAEISLVVDVSGWPHAAVLKMPITAFARAAVYAGGFLEHGRQTGARSRPN